MKTPLALSLAFALTAAALHAGPADDVAAAAKKLGAAPNYSWTLTTEFANSQFPVVPVEGATEKGGYTVVTTSFNGNTRQTVRKGEQVVLQNRDGEWVTLEELRQQAGGGGRGRGFGMFGGGPAQRDLARDVETLAAKLKDAKLVDGAIAGTLAPEDAAEFLTFGRSAQGAPAPKDASGNVKFWLKDGSLAKYALHVKGTVTTPNGDEREVDVTTTTEFKNIGTTSVTVPEPAKKKLGS